MRIGPLALLALPLTALAMSSHIVLFKRSATMEVVEEYIKKVEAGGGKITSKYEGSTKGFAAQVSPQVLATLNEASIADDSPIQIIEADKEVKIM